MSEEDYIFDDEYSDEGRIFGPDPKRKCTHVIKHLMDDVISDVYVYEDGDSLGRVVQLLHISGHIQSIKDIEGNDCVDH